MLYVYNFYTYIIYLYKMHLHKYNVFNIKCVKETLFMTKQSRSMKAIVI